MIATSKQGQASSGVQRFVDAHGQRLLNSFIGYSHHFFHYLFFYWMPTSIQRCSGCSEPPPSPPLCTPLHRSHRQNLNTTHLLFNREYNMSVGSAWVYTGLHGSTGSTRVYTGLHGSTRTHTTTDPVKTARHDPASDGITTEFPGSDLPYFCFYASTLA